MTAGAFFLASLAQGLAHFFGRIRTPCPRPHTFGIFGKIDGNKVAFQPFRFHVAGAELVPKAVSGASHLELPDALEPMIFGNDHRDLQSFLAGGDQLGGIHQIGSVSDENENLPLRLGHPDAQAGGNFIAHAGVAKLKMAPRSLADIPQLVQVTRRAARGGNNGIACLRLIVENADKLALAHRFAGRGLINLLSELLLPLCFQAGDFFNVTRTRFDAGLCPRICKSPQPFAGVSEDGQRALLISVVGRDVKADESDVRDY